MQPHAMRVPPRTWRPFSTVLGLLSTRRSSCSASLGAAGAGGPSISPSAAGGCGEKGGS